MCGICGFVKRVADIERPETIIREMLDSLRHRGPDEEGLFIDKLIALGVCRLSIIDLEKGHQPIFNEDRSKMIIFNGEIYNFLELRGELEKRGHIFYSHSDTEVIIHLYEDLGEECVHRLNGMFAFAIWDCNNKILFLARDRFGIKPLYYALTGDCLVFSSELKAILQFPGITRELDIFSLSQYLTFEYVPAPRTIFRGIFKLPAGHSLLYQDGVPKVKKYWDITWAETLETEKEEERVNELRGFIRDSVKGMLVSDVPLGFFLSGGIDSSSIVAFAKELKHNDIKTFSVGFRHSSFDETRYSSEISHYFNTEHINHIFGKDNLLELIPEIYKYFDEPLADPSIFPTFFLSKFARENVKVALAGEGGDELFAGYPTYIAHKLASIYEILPIFIRKYIIAKVIDKLPVSMNNLSFDYLVKRFTEGIGDVPYSRNATWMGAFSMGEKENLLRDEVRDEMKKFNPFSFLGEYLGHCEDKDVITTMQYLDLKTYLQDDLLVKVDRASMAHALEVRVPYLDHRLVEWVFNLPARLRLNLFETKYILKKSMKAYLPKEIIKRKKKGFSIPVAYWINGPLKDFVLDILSKERIEAQGLFNYEYINKLLQQHFTNKRDNRKQIWALLMFELWYEKYVHRA